MAWAGVGRHGQKDALEGCRAGGGVRREGSMAVWVFRLCMNGLLGFGAPHEWPVGVWGTA